ncbi:hypothetical protein T01_827 [Trichinella spiralis]|uniref:Uncharacterized protein n=1 Tax=Trichinella spiralis TaxID=6334 RepID=A0A0V1C1I9_TRISP|nr:hypothetical protein T01_827 [Trichinella spiralis]
MTYSSPDKPNHIELFKECASCEISIILYQKQMVNKKNSLLVNRQVDENVYLSSNHTGRALKSPANFTRKT